MEIPIIDIFAGPGGLGEGFSTFLNPITKQRQFKIVLSVEKDFYAHQTLKLRIFFREFEPDDVPGDFYQFIKGNISLNELYTNWPVQTEMARAEAWLAELGEGKNAAPDKVLIKK